MPNLLPSVLVRQGLQTENASQPGWSALNRGERVSGLARPQSTEKWCFSRDGNPVSIERFGLLSLELTSVREASKGIDESWIVLDIGPRVIV